MEEFSKTESLFIKEKAMMCIDFIYDKNNKNISRGDHDINELIDDGYVIRTKTRGADGRITKWEYEVFEEPCKTIEQSNEEPCWEKPGTALSHQEKPEEDYPEQDIPELESSSTETKDTCNTIIKKNGLSL